MTAPADWQLPPGVDRGLWDYLHSDDMVAGYDAQIAESPLARLDVAFCETAFTSPGRLVDLGCGTGRLAIHFAARGFDCVGVDLADEMLAKARANADARGVKVEWVRGNLVDLAELPSASFDYAACLFSTLGMLRGEANRRSVVANAARLLKPCGRFVLHVHNRWYFGLGRKQLAKQAWRTILRRASAGDVTMRQAYGGAPLTLHHFTRREAKRLLEDAGFVVKQIEEIEDNGGAWPASRTYGYLLLAERIC